MSSLNIIDLVKGQLGPALVSQAASFLGESESGVSKTIDSLLPAVVGGMAENADNPAITNAINSTETGGILSNLLGASSYSPVTSVVSTLFGDKLAGLVHWAAEHSGVSEASAGTLLNLVTGATLGTVANYAAENNLGTSGISSLLSSQKGIASALLPAGLSLASFGLKADNWADKAKDTVESVASTAKDNFDENVAVAKEKISATSQELQDKIKASTDGDGGGSIWKWLLPLLLVLLAGWFLWKQCDKKKETTTTTAATTDSLTVDATDSVNVAKVGDTTVVTDKQTITQIDLNGVKLNAYANGMEVQMIEFLKSGGYKNAADDAALKDKWYNFDRVTFKMGSSTELNPGSQEQIDNLVAILKAFPDAKIKVGGYTDKTGNEASNLKLSQARADFIKAALAKAGVGGQVLEAKGYGSQFATVPATASDAERAADRKMAVRFAK